MSLGPASVKRPWEVHDGGMAYRMDVELGGYEKVGAIFHVRHNCLDQRGLPPDYIERELQRRIVDHIRGELFPRTE